MPSKEVAKKETAISPFVIFNTEIAAIREAMVTNVGDEGITAGDFERIKVPAGGGTAWTLQGLDGEELVKELSGITALGATVITAVSSSEPPLTVYGPGSNLADKTLLQLTSAGELIIAGGSGNGYCLAELMSASNPSGWSGVLKVKTAAGTTLGYILLYSNP